MDPNKDTNDSNPILKETLESTLNQVDKVLENVDNVVSTQTSDITKMPTQLVEKLDPYSLGIAHRDTDINTGTEFKLHGIKVNNEDTFSDPNEELARSITASNTMINTFMPNGNHAYIRMVEQNVYLEENFPTLKQSLDLFVDSVLNGSFTGYEPNSGRSMFKFYDKSGKLIENSTEIETYNELLNPKRSLSSTNKTYMEIERNVLYNERRDGLAIVRYIMFQKVLKELYIKYILKKTKAKKMKAGAKTVKIARVPNNLPKPGNENIEMNWRTLLGNVNIPLTLQEWTAYGYTVEQVDSFGVETVYEYGLTKSNINDREYREVFDYGNESFINFVERYTTGGTQDLLLYNPDPHEHYDENGKPYFKKITHCVGFESGRYTQDTALEIIEYAREHIFDFGGINMFGTESANSDHKFIHDTLSGLESLNNTSFDDLYNTCWPDNLDINNVSYGMESEESLTLRSTLENTTHTLFYDTLRLVDIDLNKMNYGLENYNPIEAMDLINGNYALNHIQMDIPKPVSQIAKPLSKVNDNIVSKTYNIKPDGTSDEKIPHGRIQRLFESIRGGVVEILDGQRCVPIFAGSRALGVFYVTHTHELMRNLVLTRQFMNQPKNFMNITDTEYEYAGSQEELVGRMMFSDHIKPIIEKNISTKFLRENAEVMYTIHKILEEQELSNTLTYADISNYNMMNLSRVMFIPASELHIARNTDRGFGESFFQKARVPANFRIAGNEAYLGWIIQDGKPLNILRVQAGLNDGGGMYGVDSVIRQIQAKKLTRGSLRRIQSRGQTLGSETIVYQSQGAEDLLNLTTIPGSENRIERDFIRAWEVEATTIVGFSSALFTTEDGRIELARKLGDLDEIQTHKIFHEQVRTVRAASQRATKLLHLRGGSSVENIIVEYIPPYLTRDNNVKHSEILDEATKTFSVIKELFDNLFEGNADYEENRADVYSEILRRMKISENLITERYDILEAAKRNKNTYLATNKEEE